MRRADFWDRFNEPVACPWLLGPGAQSLAVVGYYSFHAGGCRVSAVALMASAPKGDCPGPLGIGLHHGVCGDDPYYRPARHDPRPVVYHRRQRTSGYRLWDLVGWRAKVRRQK